MALPLFDLLLDELCSHRSKTTSPDDLDRFGSEAIDEARARSFEPRLEPHRSDVYRRLEVFDVTFAGARGDPGSLAGRVGCVQDWQVGLGRPATARVDPAL
jgi:cephalosporin-C deacetylase-like acetyl esterase